jgi:hypothetical protein
LPEVPPIPGEPPPTTPTPKPEEEESWWAKRTDIEKAGIIGAGVVGAYLVYKHTRKKGR